MRLSRQRVHIDTSNLVPRSSSIVKLKEREDKEDKKINETSRHVRQAMVGEPDADPDFGQPTAEILGIVVPGVLYTTSQ